MTATDSVISYPIPPYQNVPIQPEFYTPRRWVIEDITLGENTIITTTTPMDYVVGQQVRLLIPPTFGTRGLNEQTAYVLEILSDDSVLLDISSLGMDTFINSPARTKPEILAIGNINSGATNNNGRKNNLTYIPGSFKNISPQ